MPMQISISNAIGGGGGSQGGAPKPSFADTTSFLLDQVDDHLLGTSNWGTISGSGEFTISLWVKFTTLSGIQKLFQCNDTGTGYILYGFYRGDTGQIEVWSGGSGSNWTRSVAGAIVAGQWSHIVMRLDTGTGNRYTMQKIFIDGVHSNGGSNYYTNSIVQGSELSVGAAPSAIQSIDGNINEFAVWGSNALTDAQILEVYNSGSANDLKTLKTAPIPTNWFRSENANWLGSYYELVDEMGSGYKLNTRNMSQASRVNDVPPTFNIFSTYFDGNDDYVDCGDNNNLSFGDSVTDSPFSISAWVKMTDEIRFKIVSKKGANQEYQFVTTGGGGVALYLYDNSTGARIARYGASLSAYRNTWIHVCATYDGNSLSTGIKCYVNGVQNDLYTSASGTYTAMENTIQSVEIGREGSYYAEGNIDEASIFDVELSASDVTTIYNSGVPNDISGMSGLVSWWRMGDNDTYPTINDLGSGGNNGTMNNMSSANFVTDVP